MRTSPVMAGLLLAASLAACAGDSEESAQPVAATSGRPSAHPSTAEPVASPSGAATAPVGRVVNGRITDFQSHFRTPVRGYSPLPFDSASDRGLLVGNTWCDECRPVVVMRMRLTVLAPTGRVATLACPDGTLCRARRFGNDSATLGPGADELTVESGDRMLSVVGYDGTLRRTIDLTAALPRGRDIGWLAWSPDGSRLAILTYKDWRRGDIWLMEGDDTPVRVYQPGNQGLGRPAGWSPDGQSLLFDRFVLNGRGEVRTFGADVVVLHRSSSSSPPAMTLRTLYRSNRHFDWAGNVAWSPDGTRIAVRVKGGVVEISAADGKVLARHPHIGGLLIWLRRDR